MIIHFHVDANDALFVTLYSRLYALPLWLSDICIQNGDRWYLLPIHRTLLLRTRYPTKSLLRGFTPFDSFRPLMGQ